MFNSLGRTPSPRVTTHPPQHHSHRCPLFQVQRKHPLHRNPHRRPTTLNPKAPTSPTPIHAPLCAHQIAKIQHALYLNCPSNSTPAQPPPKGAPVKTAPQKPSFKPERYNLN